MAKLTLSDLSGGYLAPAVINSNNTAIEAALENTLSRDGTSPNAMGANLDMNSNRIINLPAPAASTDALRLVDLADSDATGAATAQLRIDLLASGGSALVGFIQLGTGAVLRTAQSKLREWVTPEDFGAVGDGTTDDKTAVTNAFATGKVVRGIKGSVYAVSGNVTMPGTLKAQDLHFKQLDSAGSTSRRTLVVSTGTGPLELRRIKVDRNGQTSEGSISNAAGIWIADVDDVVLEDVEVTGNSKGVGINIIDCNRVRVTRPYVHDMRWSDAIDPGTEQVVGVWFQRCTYIDITDYLIGNLDGVIGANPARAYQTDGLDFSGCSYYSVKGGKSYNVGEGIDTSGSDGNNFGSYVGITFIDCDSYGLKFANSARDHTVTGCQSIRCGLAGFTVGGPSQASLQGSSNITFTNCTAIDTGSNGNWAASNPTGFSVLSGTFAPKTQGIIFIGCRAIDRQGSATMKYGFRGETKPDFNIKRLNKLLDCYSEGYTIAKTLQYIGDVFAMWRKSNTQSLPNNTFTTLEFNNGTGTVDDYAMGVAQNTTITKCFTFDGAAYTDETTDINSAGAADVPPFLDVNDAIYFGHTEYFNVLKINVNTAAVSGVVAWEYWNGSAWVAISTGTTLSGTAITLTDGTANAGVPFGNTGTNNVRMSGIPSNWTAVAVNGSSDYYWIRARVTTALTVAPTLTQAWLHRDLLVYEDGLYRIRAQADFDASAAGSRQIRIAQNGTSIPGHTGIFFANATTVGMALCEAEIYLSRGDLITVEVKQDTGGAINNAVNHTYVQIRKIPGRD